MLCRRSKSPGRWVGSTKNMSRSNLTSPSMLCAAGWAGLGWAELGWAEAQESDIFHY